MLVVDPALLIALAALIQQLVGLRVERAPQALIDRSCPRTIAAPPGSA